MMMNSSIRRGASSQLLLINQYSRSHRTTLQHLQTTSLSSRIRKSSSTFFPLPNLQNAIHHFQHHRSLAVHGLSRSRRSIDPLVHILSTLVEAQNSQLTASTIALAARSDIPEQCHFVNGDASSRAMVCEYATAPVFDSNFPGACKSI